jgi:hypothetical protein
MTLSDMMQLYMRVMGINSWSTDDRFTVRVWDGMDGCWCDVIAGVDLGFALRAWCEKTENGTVKTSFRDIDYYRIFPADAKLLYSGGHTMFRDEDE